MGDFLGMGAFSTMFLATVPYMLSTQMMFLFGGDDSDKGSKEPDTEDPVGTAGFFTGLSLASGITALEGSYYAENPSYLIVPVLTNIASAIYEYNRLYAKKHPEQEIEWEVAIEKDNLETRV